MRAYVRFHFSIGGNTDVCICVILFEKVNYFLGENRKVIDRSKMMTMIDVFMDYY